MVHRSAAPCPIGRVIGMTHYLQEVSSSCPSSCAILLSGQTLICTNCGTLVCRSFAFTPKILSIDPKPRLHAANWKRLRTHEKKAILHNFSATSVLLESTIVEMP